MVKEVYLKISRKIFVLSLPVLAVIFANLAVKAHFTHFCLIKFITGHECWGCGLTRAFAALSRLDVQKALEYNPLIIVVVPLLTFIWIMLLKKEFRQ